MSELGKKVFGATQAVENTLASTVKDFESGVGAFISGGNAHTHEPEPVREPQFTEPAKEASQERSAPRRNHRQPGRERDAGLSGADRERARRAGTDPCRKRFDQLPSGPGSGPELGQGWPAGQHGRTARTWTLRTSPSRTTARACTALPAVVNRLQRPCRRRRLRRSRKARGCQ